MAIQLFLIGTLVLVLAGVPISYALGAGSLLYLLMADIPPVTFAQHLARGINSYTLLALPFFILTGQLMNQGGITDTLFRFANSVVGHIRGGLAHANILGAMLFASIAGSAVAAAGALGTIQLTAMEKNGYDRRFSVGLISGAMTIGPIIPPSVVMVVYGIAASVSIGDLFLGGIVPGLLMGFALMGLVAWLAPRRNLPRYHDGFDPKAVWTAFRGAGFALLAPVIVIGGIISGVFTATEAGAVGALYSFLVGRYYYRELTIRRTMQALIDTMLLSTVILLIMGMSSIFAWILAFERIPAMAAEFIPSISENPYIILLILILFYLVLGCFLEAIAVIVMTIPVVLPVIIALGIDPVHFGVVLAINLAIGTITPPLGIVMYVMTNLARIGTDQYARAILPFLGVLVGVMTLVAMFPPLVTFLPGLRS